MRFTVIYLSTLAVMLPLDFAFLSTIGKKLFAANVGDMVLDTPRLPPAILFYALYLAGVVIFVNGTAPANRTHNLVYGALFGVICYATFELTNMSLLKHWEWSVVVPDIVWGAAMTAISASVGGLLAKWIVARVA
jgi:uncharacterized membrane protein